MEGDFEVMTRRDRYFAQLTRELDELLDPSTGKLSARFARSMDCPLCEGREKEEFLVRRGYTFVRCVDCGLIYTDPMVQPDLLRQAYKSSLADELWVDVLLSETEVAWRSEYFASNLALIEVYVSGGRLLDVGCSIGQFMEIAQARGWTAMGLELGDRAFEYATKRRGLHVLQEAIEVVDLDEGSFDCITAFGVLEHVPAPRAVLQHVRRLLKPGGVFMAVVPNPYSLLNVILHEKSVTFDGRNHVIHYGWESLRRLMVDSSLEVLTQDTVLTGLPNLLKYVQYFDPYGASPQRNYLAPALHELLATPYGRQRTEDWIVRSNLGLRIRIVARRTHEDV